MTSSSDVCTQVTHPAEVEQLLQSLARPGGASLALEESDTVLLPVVLSSLEPDRWLTLDLSAAREVAGALRHGGAFRILGQAGGGMVRTPPLRADECVQKEGRLWCRCPYPGSLELVQRRATFRARLRSGMDVAVSVSDSRRGLSTLGDLRDLSLQGCLMDLHAGALTAAMELEDRLTVTLTFPDGGQITLDALPRHRVADPALDTVRAGLRFLLSGAEEERRLWFLVREVEREAARRADPDRTDLAPSSLFQRSAPAAPRRAAAHPPHPLPMVGRLARCATYLDNQILLLRQGGHVDPVQLSRQAERLLALHDQDREALLFATRCLGHEPLLVRHGLGVAVHLLDLARARAMPRALCKALAAAAMVHDLGKALLPRDLLALPVLNERQHRWLQGHVPMLLQRLDRCGWLSSPVIEAVIGDINERLDGSGYPNRRRGDDLSQLARLAAVVDVVDIMSRARPGREPRGMDDIHDWLRRSPQAFDPEWVCLYRDHFGRWPVGSLVRYRDGLLGRVRALGDDGLPSCLWVGEGDTAEWLQGEALTRRGAPDDAPAAPAD